MTLVKYAVRVPWAGGWLYRSASSRWFVMGWDDAQLWSNAKAAEKEVRSLHAHPDRSSTWDGFQRHGLSTAKAEVVAVNIGEPL